MEKENFKEKLKKSIPYALALLLFIFIYGWIFDIIDKSHMSDKHKKITKALTVIIPIVLYFIWTTYNMLQIDYL